MLLLSIFLCKFLSESKFSETETETFFRDQFFSKPKPRLFFRNQIFRYRYRNPQKSFETEMSISGVGVSVLLMSSSTIQQKLGVVALTYNSISMSLLVLVNIRMCDITCSTISLKFLIIPLFSVYTCFLDAV